MPAHHSKPSPVTRGTPLFGYSTRFQQHLFHSCGFNVSPRLVLDEGGMTFGYLWQAGSCGLLKSFYLLFSSSSLIARMFHVYETPISLHVPLHYIPLCFFSSPCSTPPTTFPILLRMLYKHLCTFSSPCYFSSTGIPRVLRNL